MQQIFLSYRRADSEHATGRISDRLRQTLGSEAVFRDVDTVRLGEDFEKRVDTILKQCAVMLVIIGEEWLDLRKKDSDERRLDDPDDLVRREISAALENEETVVIPVLIGNAEMPKPENLPEDLKPLAYRNAATVRADSEFDNQVAALIEEILVQAPNLRPVVRYAKMAAMVAGTALLLGAAWWGYQGMRAPNDLTKITWNSESYEVVELEFDEVGYQAVYLRDGPESSKAMLGAPVRKYDLDIKVTRPDGSDGSELLSVKEINWDELPEDHKGRDHQTMYLEITAGEWRGIAHISVCYESCSDEAPVKPSERVIEVFAPRELERRATAAFNEVDASIADTSLDDSAILEKANRLLDRDSNELTKALSQTQVDSLKKTIAGTSAAHKQFEVAKSKKASSHSLAARDSGWKDYLELAEKLGRSESPQIRVANEERKGIQDYRDTMVNSVEAAACLGVNDRNCVQPKTCFDSGTRISSWVKLDVDQPRLDVSHRLVSVDGEEIVRSNRSEVTESNSYRTWKIMDAPQGTGAYELQVIAADVVVVSNEICFGECSACP